MKSMGLSGVTIEASLEVENLNLGRLDGTNIRFKIRKKSDGTVLAQGDVPREFSIPGGEKTIVKFPVTFGFGGMGAVGGSIIRRGETDLVLDGNLTFVAPMAEKGTVDIPYNGEARIILSEDPPP
jgi:hypothetical protein